MKLALGTAQFGMQYGRFNAAGQPSRTEVARILDMAAEAGIRVLDTARLYGESEAALGGAGAGRRFAIVTKCPGLDGEEDPAAAMAAHFAASCEQLGVDRVHGYMLHRAQDLLETRADAVWGALEALRDEGRAERIGVSVYGADELGALIGRFPVGIVQLPAHALLGWYRDESLAALCRARGVEVHTRSTFLQGFLLANPERLSGYLGRWRGVLAQFRARAAELGLTPLQAAIGAVSGQQAINHVVVGIDSAAQLAEILEAASAAPPAPDAFADLECGDADLTDPRRWRQ